MDKYPVYYIDYFKAGDVHPYRNATKEHFYYREEVLIEAVLNLELTDAVKAIVRYKEVEPDSDICPDSSVIYEIHKKGV